MKRKHLITILSCLILLSFLNITGCQFNSNTNIDINAPIRTEPTEPFFNEASSENLNIEDRIDANKENSNSNVPIVTNNVNLPKGVLAVVNGKIIKEEYINKYFGYDNPDPNERTDKSGGCFNYEPLECLKVHNGNAFTAYNLVFIYMILDHAKDYGLNPDNYIQEVAKNKEIYESEKNEKLSEDDEELFSNYIKAECIFNSILEQDSLIKEVDTYIKEKRISNPFDIGKIKAPFILAYFNKWAGDETVQIDVNKINSL